MTDTRITSTDGLTLARFVARVMTEHRNGGYPGDVDGGWLQDLATECGLLEEAKVTEPCEEEGCVCAEFGFPTTCYRNSALLRRCHAASVSTPAGRGAEGR